MKLWIACLCCLVPVLASAQAPTGYTLAVFPPGTAAPAGSSVLPVATAPTPVFPPISWLALAMTCGQPAVPTTSTPLPVTPTLSVHVNFTDPNAGTQDCTFDLSPQLQPQVSKLTPGLIYPVGVQAVNATGASDWDLSSDPFQRPVLPPAVPIGLVLTR
jgi:hypothetical protein